MPSISFSLTEQWIINPVLTMRAPLPPGPEPTWTATVWQAIESEVVARIVALFTSVVALLDTLVHLAVGICTFKVEHFKQAAWFGFLTLIGSIAGMIWPDVFKKCPYSPPPPSYDFPDHIRKLADMDMDTLKKFWKEASLEDRHWFVLFFNRSEFHPIRATLARDVYATLEAYNVRWLSSEEVDARIQHICSQAFFYHATSEKALESILKSKRVEVRHEKAYRGAFASTQPETGFGRCILAFRRNIERLSTLQHGFPLCWYTYWAGFSRDIPVTEETLAYIMLDGGSYQECQEMKAKVSAWAGRPIEVITLSSARRYLNEVQNLGMGIPSEWPGNDPQKDTIINTMRARAAAQYAVQPAMMLQQRQMLMYA